MGMNETPSGERVHIAFFGRRNAGKSSLVNAVTGQELAIVSDIRGTTTDPVYKSMELLPLGPVVIIDTPGIDDEGELGLKRVGKTRQVLNKADLAVLVVDAVEGISSWEEEMIRLFEKKEIPYLVVYNKMDLLTGKSEQEPVVEHSAYVSARTREGIQQLKEQMARLTSQETDEKRLAADLVKPFDTVILVVPIDKEAPKGRLILPQQQVIRDLLDIGAMPFVCRESELSETFAKLKEAPALVITDSQVFPLVDRLTPPQVRLTSFSILFARYKGDLKQAAEGAKALEMIQDALLFQDRKAFSTIDAAVISLKTGILKLLKAGGMATFIRHRNSVERIVPAALPPGCRINQQFDLKYKKLYDGDMVIMVSDGMLEFESMPEIPFRMESLIEKIKTDNAQVFADQLIEAVPVLEDGYDDDRTVLVASIWEKGHRNVE